MKICILDIATNKYIQFVEQLLESVDFLNGHDISALVFTDHEIEEVSDNVRSHRLIMNMAIPTLKRYHYFTKEKEYISQFDYCFYMDVDMRIEGKVGDEIFGDSFTQHPGFWWKDKERSVMNVVHNPLHMFLKVKERCIMLVDLMVVNLSTS